MPKTTDLQTSIERWMTIHAFVMLLATITFLLIDNALPLAIIAGLSFIVFFAMHFAHWRQFGFLGGAANVVTWLRLAALIAMTVFVDQLIFLEIGLLALFVTGADGLDGWLARKYKTSSLFGEYFDKEIDAFFVLLMGALIYHFGLLEWWILIPGILRYVYFLIIRNLKPPEKKEGRSFKGQTIAVILMVSLISCFLMPENIYTPATGVAIILVFYSFVEEFKVMLKRR